MKQSYNRFTKKKEGTCYSQNSCGHCGCIVGNFEKKNKKKTTKDLSCVHIMLRSWSHGHYYTEVSQTFFPEKLREYFFQYYVSLIFLIFCQLFRVTATSHFITWWHCNWKIAGSNPTRHLAWLREPTSLRGSWWPFQVNLSCKLATPNSLYPVETFAYLFNLPALGNNIVTPV